MDWGNCDYDDEVYAELKKLISAEQGDEPYPMSLTGGDYVPVASAWNQGIDSHLEAITERSSLVVTDKDSPFGPRANFSIHPEELPVLVRRLFGSGAEDAYSLASGILSTLNIEVI
jgi:hypothetical protein